MKNPVAYYMLLARASDEILANLEKLAKTTPRLMSLETIADHFSVPVALVQQAFETVRPEHENAVRKTLFAIGTKLLADALVEAEQAKLRYGASMLELTTVRSKKMFNILDNAEANYNVRFPDLPTTYYREIRSVMNRSVADVCMILKRMHKSNLVRIFHSTMMSEATAHAFAESYLEE